MKSLWLALLGSAALLQLASSRQVAQKFNVQEKEAFPLEIEQDIGAIQEQGEALKEEQLQVGQEQGQLQERWGGWFGFPRFGGFGKKGFHHRRWDDDDGKKGRRRHRRHRRHRKDDDDDDDGKKGRRRHRRHRRHRGKK